jgi:predicted RNA binding protein YcfA (HicA-like mRNA interferase family)
MPKVPRLSGARLVAALMKLGFVKMRQRGSHLLMRRQRPEAGAHCVVPMHRELATGTLHGILKQAGVTVEELLAVL